MTGRVGNKEAPVEIFTMTYLDFYHPAKTNQIISHAGVVVFFCLSTHLRDFF